MNNRNRSKEYRVSDDFVKLYSEIKKGLHYLGGFLRHKRDIYPVLIFALIPALSFWGGANVTELTFPLMLRSLIAAVVSGVLIYLLLLLILKGDSYRASILAIVAIYFTYTYRYIYLFYRDRVSSIFGEQSDLRAHSIFMLLLLLLYVFVYVLVTRKLKFSKNIRNYVSIFATVLLVMNLYPIVKQYVDTHGLNSISFGNKVEASANSDTANKPDIYYFVFDRYANNKVLKEIYNYDNSPFLSFLKQKGFYIADNAAANYPATTLSLASSLNLDYLPQELNNGRVDNGLYTSTLHNAVEDNRVAEFLKENDYNFINIGPWWNTTKYNKNADQNLYNPSGVVVAGKTIDLQEHEMLLFQDTIFWQLSNKPRTLFNRVFHRRTYPSGDTAGRAVHKQTFEHQFKTVKQIAHEPGPKFVFTHVLLPHDPYVVDENCNPSDKSKLQPRYQNEYELYIKQLKCANKNIKAMVDNILVNNPTDPIIIIQADEGPYPIEFRNNKELEWNKASTQLLEQKEKILSSYYFPEKDYSMLYPNVSPVNTFRIIFNKYFGTDLPLQTDRHYFNETRSRRSFLFEVTDRFNNSNDIQAAR